MKNLKLIITLLILFLIESTILSSFPIYSTTIPLSYSFALAVAIYEDKWDILIFGLLCGFLHDMYSANLFGINMLLDMWSLILIGYLAKYLRKENHILMAILMGLTGLLRFSIQVLIYRFTGKIGLIASLSALVLLITLLGIPMIRLYYWLLRVKHKKRKYKYN